MERLYKVYVRVYLARTGAPLTGWLCPTSPDFVDLSKRASTAATFTMSEAAARLVEADRSDRIRLTGFVEIVPGDTE